MGQRSKATGLIITRPPSAAAISKGCSAPQALGPPRASGWVWMDAVSRTTPDAKAGFFLSRPPRLVLGHEILAPRAARAEHGRKHAGEEQDANAGGAHGTGTLTALTLTRREHPLPERYLTGISSVSAATSRIACKRLRKFIHRIRVACGEFHRPLQVVLLTIGRPAFRASGERCHPCICVGFHTRVQCCVLAPALAPSAGLMATPRLSFENRRMAAGAS